MLYRANGEALRYQAVRFRKPGFTFRRVLTFTFYCSIVYTYLAFVWRQMDVEIEFVEDEESLQQQEGAETVTVVEEAEDDGPMYADEESTFIPLTWSTKMPRSFYKGSDPEWQEFIRIAKDPARHKKIQDELVQIVFTGCTQHPAIARQLGKDMKVGKYWLDIQFPDGPPQEYERRGIEIGEGFVAWSTQKVDAEKQWRTERALMPKAVADGVWRTTKVLVGIQWRRAMQYLGLETADPTSPEERLRLAIQMQQQQSDQKEGRTGAVVQSSAASKQSSPSTTSDTVSRQDRPWHIPNIPMPRNPFSTSATKDSSFDEQGWSVPVELPIAIHVFSSTLSKSWNPKTLEPPRGGLVVQGLVEVRGSKGRMLFDVQSCYDPHGGQSGVGASKFVHVNLGVRGFKRWRQSPRGGP